MTFFLPDRPADDDLYNEAVDAGIAWSKGELDEDTYLDVMARFQRAERAHWEAAWQAAG